MKKYDKQRLFEVLGKIDPTFKPSAQLLTEWNFDKKKGEDKEEDKEKLKKLEKLAQVRLPQFMRKFCF